MVSLSLLPALGAMLSASISNPLWVKAKSAMQHVGYCCCQLLIHTIFCLVARSLKITLLVFVLFLVRVRIPPIKDLCESFLVSIKTKLMWANYCYQEAVLVSVSLFLKSLLYARDKYWSTAQDPIDFPGLLIDTHIQGFWIVPMLASEQLVWYPRPPC